MSKIRRIDFYPDEFISGVGGRLSAVDQGVYWMVCTLIYSHGGPIDDDHVWLSRLFADTHWRTVRASLDRLIDAGKIERTEAAGRPQIIVRRCASELQKARKRVSEAVQNGRKGGRPRKENNGLDKPNAFPDEKLTTNQQPPTNNQQPKDISFDDDFAEWYAAYPRREGRGRALKAYRAARKKADAETLLRAARGAAEFYRRSERRFIPMPASWLNDERWLDEVPDSAPPADDGEGREQSTADVVAEIDRQYREWGVDY